MSIEVLGYLINLITVVVTIVALIACVRVVVYYLRYRPRVWVVNARKMVILAVLLFLAFVLYVEIQIQFMFNGYSDIHVFKIVNALSDCVRAVMVMLFVYLFKVR